MQSAVATTHGSEAEQARLVLFNLSAAVREMTPIGAKKIPAEPKRFNLLARPHGNVCRFCGLPGHQSISLTNAASCHTAILSLFDFWEDIAEKVNFLQSTSTSFNDAITKHHPTYELRHDNTPQVGGEIEKVLLDRLTRNYLKFQAWVSRVRAKINVLVDMEGQEGKKYEVVSGMLNGTLLRGKTLSELFVESLEDKKITVLD